MVRQLGFRDVLAVREFRALWLAELISVCGDQLARVALSVLVFQRTNSATLTALTYALTFVPALVGGALLAGLADRFPRRAVLISTDLIRAVLAGSLALPLPLPALWILVFGLALAGAPFKAAQLATLPDVLEGERLPIGLALRTVTTQMAQLVGFLGGGTVLLLVSVPTTLGVNATTFLVSAMIIRAGVRVRPAARISRGGSGLERPASAVRILRRSPKLLALVGLTTLAGLTVAPEGVAAPYASGLGGSAIAVGLLLAADPLGSVLGAWTLSRWRSSTTRSVAMIPLAIASGLVLVPCFLRPGLALSFGLWALSGACTTVFLIQAQALLIRAVPDDRRAAVIGLASGGLQASQGLVILFAGLLGDQVGVYRAVGVVGVITAVLAAFLGLIWRRARPRNQSGSQDEHDASHGMSETSSQVTVAHSGHLLPRVKPRRTK